MHSTLSDEDLVRACAASKDTGLWEEFIRRFNNDIALAVRRALFQRAVTSPDAVLEDLLQDTYAKLYDTERNPLSRFEPRDVASARSFLRVVAMNLVFDHLRAKRREKSHVPAALNEDSQDRLPAPSQDGGSPWSIERGILLKEVDSALAGSEASTMRRDRQIFWFHYREGMSAREISELPWISLTVKGVESTLFRATQLVRNKLAHSRQQALKGEAKGKSAAGSL